MFAQQTAADIYHDQYQAEGITGEIIYRGTSLVDSFVKDIMVYVIMLTIHPP